MWTHRTARGGDERRARGRLSPHVPLSATATVREEKHTSRRRSTSEHSVLRKTMFGGYRFA